MWFMSLIIYVILSSAVLTCLSLSSAINLHFSVSLHYTRTPDISTPASSSLFQSEILLLLCCSLSFPRYNLSWTVSPFCKRLLPWLPSSTITHLPPTCLPSAIPTMSFSTSRSRRGHITTTIYRQTSPEPQLDISEITSSTAGRRKIKRRVIVQPSPSHLSASTSASPAPSSISTHSHDPHPPFVQWDLPTSQPPSHQQLSDTSKTPCTTVQIFFPPFLLSWFVAFSSNLWIHGSLWSPPSSMRSSATTVLVHIQLMGLASPAINPFLHSAALSAFQLILSCANPACLTHIGMLLCITFRSVPLKNLPFIFPH